MPAFLRSLLQAVFARITVSTARTADYVGTAFDTIDYDGTLKVLMDVGTVSGTTPSCTFTIHDSDTSGGTYAETTAAKTTAAAITATGVREIDVDVSKCKRWIKVSGTITGTSPSFAVAESCVGFKKYQ